MYDYGARYYDPRTSMFLGVDPLAEEYSFQAPYAYAVNNPLKYIDWMGMGPGDKVSGYDYKSIKNNYTRVTGGQGIINTPGSALNWAKGENSCAIRMSDALNKAGYNIPRSQETPKDVRIQNGNKTVNNNNNFVLDAVSMGNYLSDIEEPTLSFNNLNSQDRIDKAMEQIDALGDVQGIIVLKAGNQEAYGATGHVDLLEQDWSGEQSLYGNGVLGFGNDLDDYLESNKNAQLSIDIWILKPKEDE